MSGWSATSKVLSDFEVGLEHDFEGRTNRGRSCGETLSLLLLSAQGENQQLWLRS